jgi:hypothetical protein
VKWCIISILGMSIISQISYLVALTVTNVSISEEINCDKNQIFFITSDPKDDIDSGSIRLDIGDDMNQDSNEGGEFNGQLTESLLSFNFDDKRLSSIERCILCPMLAFYRFINLLYVVVYFYFTPFLVLLLVEALKYKNPKLNDCG